MNSQHLTCPYCRGEYLHHGQVTVYDRREDAPRLTKTEVRDRTANITAIDNKDSGNPSERRDGVAVRFWCEHCDTISELTIAQHKGASLLGWRILREEANGHPQRRA
jgi:hypothetical protein